MEHSCVDCAIKKCNTGKGKYPEFRATEHMPDEVLADAMACYEEKENREVSVAAARVEYEHYCQYTRVQEIMAFAENMHMKKLGIATCVGLLNESRTLARIFGTMDSKCMALPVRQVHRRRRRWESRRNVMQWERICAIRFCRRRC